MTLDQPRRSPPPADGSPPHFARLGTHAEFRPHGSVKLLQGIVMIRAAIAYAREQGIANLLVSITGLSGFQPPGVLDRVWMAHQFAATAGAAVKVAVVAPAALIHPQKIGAMVARNRGMATDVFAEEVAALAWLLDPAAR